jgi:MraZ protein
VIIPSKYREQLGAQIAIMRGVDCIELYSQGEWNAVYEKYENFDKDGDRKAFDRMRRLLFTSEDSNVPDKQGRLLIPQHLREWAKLSKDVVISGAGRHVEIWDKDAFYAFINGDEAEGEG